jgi:hypothetical protein
VTQTPKLSLAEQVASQAEFIVNSLAQTDYQHTEYIDVDRGRYDCDCSGFVGFVLERTAPAHYALIPRETDQPRPRAFEYYEFFSHLTSQSTGGWHQIVQLRDARRGDVIAWRFPTIEPGQDTGHVFFVGETPTVDDSGVFSVRVYDSADRPHFDDTRGNGKGQPEDGVGSGIIKFRVNAVGEPTAFQFGPSDKAETFPIHIARTEALLSQVPSDGSAAPSIPAVLLSELKLDQSALKLLTDATADETAKSALSDSLGVALKSALVSASTAAGHGDLANLIAATSVADVVADKDLSLRDFVSKAITLPSDPTQKAEVEAAVASVSSTTMVGDLLELGAPINANPILAGVVNVARMATLLETSSKVGSNALLIDDFISHYAAFDGKISDFWSTLGAKTELAAFVPELQLTLQLGTLTLDNPSLVAAIRARYPQATSPRDLTTMSVDDWTQLVASQKVPIPTSIAGNTSTERASNYAGAMVDTLKKAFPGTMFRHELQKTLAGSSSTVDRNVSAVLDDASDFDILKTNLSTHVKQSATPLFKGIAEADQTATSHRLAMWQRVARVTTDVPTATALVSAGYASAYDIASTPRASFMNSLDDALGSTTTEAVYARAQHIASTAMAFYTNIRMALTAKLPRAIGDLPGDLAHQLSGPAGIPDWQELFGSTSSCACTDCRSVYSAAAYFVDLLHFLAVSKVKGQPSALDALLARRPDLPYIKLNCANTDTELPYVDLVNEILESFVVINTGKLDADTARNTSKSVTAAELSVNPEYTQDNAYNKHLCGAVSPSPLPFDRWLLTARTYLGFLGSSLHDVMAACQNGRLANLYSVPLDPLPNIVLPPCVNYDAAKHTLNASGILTSEDLAELEALSSDSAYTVAVSKLYTESHVAGSKPVYTVPLTALPSIVLPPSVHYDIRNKLLDVTGVLTPDALAALLALSADDKYARAVKTLYTESQADVAAGTPSRIAIACEYLDISEAECEILTGMNFAGTEAAVEPTWRYYGFPEKPGSPKQPDDPNWEKTLLEVETFLQVTQIAYEDLVALVETRTLNPTLSIMLEAPATASCELSQTTIVDLVDGKPGAPNDYTLNLLHRFIRLWKKLGWAISDLDKTISALRGVAFSVNPQSVANPLLSPQFLIDIAAIQQLMAATGLSLLQTLTFWADIDTDGEGSLYLTLFQNKAVLNPPDRAFELVYVSSPAMLPALELPSPTFPNISFESDGLLRFLSAHGKLSDDEYKQITQLTQLSPDSSFVRALTYLLKNSASGTTTNTFLDSDLWN